ncbi:gp4.2 [Escherichia phage 285P]|uniref:Gp4.2 n=1 Tax=Escherichia phage 285P TaxID=669008 RepID=D3W697_9CAUD|nr:gp4.2 [Escherichia phage 285P]ACV32465.1 gp4.2 [Escherichia phage 285P]
MKKVVLLVLLTCAVLAHYANLAILSLPWNVTSKVTILILSSCVFSSVVLLAILAWLDTWPTTKKPDGLNRLHHLKMKEMEIAAGNQKTMVKTSEDNDWLLTTQCSCPWDAPCVCPERVQHGDLLTPEQAYIYGHWEPKNK